MRHVFRSAAVAAVIVFSVACGATHDTAGPSDTPSLDLGGKAAAPPLVGTSWRLVSLDGRAALPGVKVTAVFGEDGRVAGSAGCNRYFGKAAATDDRLDVGLLATTMMACADGVMQQEYAYVAAFEKVKSYRIEGGQLRLGPGPGVGTVVYRPE